MEARLGLLELAVKKKLSKRNPFSAKESILGVLTTGWP
jgi:hypothetical protein